MDRRVKELLERFASYQVGDDFPLVATRDEILALHEACTDEGSRIGLICAFNGLANLVENELNRTGGDLAAFKAHRASQIHLFLLAEARVGEYMDMHRLQYVTEREIRAGRMREDDELRRYALGDDTVFGDPVVH